MSDNIADHYYRCSRRREKRETNKIQRCLWTYNESKLSEKWYRHSARKKKKEIGIKRRTYTRKIKKDKMNFL